MVYLLEEPVQKSAEWIRAGRRNNLLVHPRTNRVSKYGRPYEVTVLQHLARHTTIPVPRVTADGFDPKAEKYYFEMEMVPGTPLDEAWPLLSDAQRQLVKAQLLDIVSQLQSLPRDAVPEPPMIPDAFFWPRCSDLETKYRTVESDAAFIDQLVATIERTSSVYEPGWTAQVARLLRCLPTGEDLVFAHGNLEPRNVLVDAASARIVAVVDWAQAGYYPVFWEYVKAHFWEYDSDFVRDGGWDGVLRPYPLHLATMYHARDLIW